MQNQVFIISPKTDFRDQLMPRLGALLESIQGVQVIGTGATNVKVRVNSDVVLTEHLTKDVLDQCFVEEAKRFSVA